MQDKEIFLETIEANQANLDRYRSGVQDYNAQSATYKDTSNQIADLTKQLSALDTSGVGTDFDKARNVSKQITGLIGDQVQIFSNLSTKYSTRLNTDTPLKDYMSNIRVSNKYLIDFMSDDYLSAWETELYGRANESYDYRKLEQGVSAMDSMKQSFMGDEQEKIQTLHQSLKSIYSSFSTGMDKDGVELDDVARRELGKQSLVLQDSLKSSLKLFEENTGNADLGLYLNDPRMSPWLAAEEPPPSPPKDKVPTGDKFPKVELEPKTIELPVSALSNWSSWQGASSSDRSAGMSEFFGRDDIVDKSTEGGGVKSVLEFDASNVLSAYENRADRGNIRKQLTENSPIVVDLSRESGIKESMLLMFLKKNLQKERLKEIIVQ